MSPSHCLAAAILAAAAGAPARADGPKSLPADVFAAPASLKLPDDVFAAVPGDDVLDVVVFGGGRVAFVRAHVLVAGKGYRSAWSDFVLRLHAYLDRNGDGLLATDEANRAPWTQILQNPFNGGNPVAQFRPGMKPVSIDSNPKDGLVSVEELSEYLKHNQGFEALGAQNGPPPDVRTESLFGHFDRDGDKALSASELAAADELVSRFDQDEDEVVTLDELTPDRSPFADRFRGNNFNNAAVDPSASAAVALTGDDARARVAARLLAKFGKIAPGSKAARIGPEPLGIDPAALPEVDSDRDGKLDLAELKRYLAHPTPHLEMIVTLAKTGQGQARIERAPAKAGSKPSPYDLPLGPPNNGSVVARLEGSELEFRAADALNQFGNFFEQQFTAADADKNGALDAKEARGNFFLNRMFPVADRNGDGKLTEAELKSYVDRTADATESRTMLTIADRGVSLHERLDADHDGRLSVRELRKAAEQLRTVEHDVQGRVASSALPRRSQLTLGRGDSRNQPNVFVVANNGNGAPGRNNPANTPAWFVGMDRNRDGDVSPREFLGAPEHFRLFDADGDGLIDASEASKAP